ncbi:hypothetical protein FB107DRAFT_207385 [Schizophyllum commune]
MPHATMFPTFAHKRSPGTALGGWQLQPFETTQPDEPVPTAKHVSAPPKETGPAISYDASIGIAIGCVAGGFILLYVVCSLYQRRARRRARRERRLNAPAYTPTKSKVVFPYKTIPDSSFNRPTPALQRPASILPWKVHSPQPKPVDNRVSFVGRAANRFSTMITSARKSKLWAPAPAATTSSRISALYRPSARYGPPICPKTAECWKLADDLVGAHPLAMHLEARPRGQPFGHNQPIMFRWAENPFDGAIVPKLKTDAINALDRLVVGPEQEAKYPTLARTGSGPKIMVTQPSSDLVNAVCRAGQQPQPSEERVLVQTPSLQSNVRMPVVTRPPHAQALQSRDINRQAPSSSHNKGGSGGGQRVVYPFAQKENAMGNYPVAYAAQAF